MTTHSRKITAGFICRKTPTDQLAEDFFDINAPEKDASVERCCRIYEDFIDAFYAYANSPEGMMMVHAFDSRFPNAEIPNLIKVGFIIWGERVGIANDL